MPFAAALLESLEQRDGNRFACEMEKLMIFVFFETSKTTMLKMGITQAAGIISPRPTISQNKTFQRYLFVRHSPGLGAGQEGCFHKGKSPFLKALKN